MNQQFLREASRHHIREGLLLWMVALKLEALPTSVDAFLAHVSGILFKPTLIFVPQLQTTNVASIVAEECFQAQVHQRPRAPKMRVVLEYKKDMRAVNEELKRLI